MYLRSLLCSLALIGFVAVAEPVPELSIEDDLEAKLMSDMEQSLVAGDGEQEGEEAQQAQTEGEQEQPATQLYDATPPGIEAVQLYDQEDLVTWINQNQHLNRVKEDECQLVEDIEARAEKVALPAYQFLWGDMLAWGVCVEPNPELGIMYMRRAADQGLAAALEQLGRYYANGVMVQQDYNKAIPLLRESAGQGFVKAQLQLVELYVEGRGSPYDYEDAYRWLHHSIIADKKTHQQASMLLAKLAQRMPGYVVERAKASNVPY